jgi:hypothetical protein
LATICEALFDPQAPPTTHKRPPETALETQGTTYAKSPRWG